MNEKFGFLSNFGGLKVNFKNKDSRFITPKHGELTDNPPIVGLRNNNVLLTDDDDSDSDDNLQQKPVKPSAKPSQVPKTKPIMNRILDSSSSSLSNKIVGSSQHDKCNPRDTIVGSFSDEDEELCSQLDGMKVKDKTPMKKQPKESLKDTVVGDFSDISTSDRLTALDQVKSKLRETVIRSFSDDSDEDLILPPPSLPLTPNLPVRRPKVSLADTIIGFSESMSGLSLRQSEIPIQEEEVVENSESDESNEVISVLDSDEEEDNFQEGDQPPVLSSADNFENCSSVNSENKDRDSNSTLNRFFNNPPSLRSSEIVVTHSVVRKHLEAPRPEPLPKEIKESESNISQDRFKTQNAEAQQEEVDLSETNESLQDKSQPSQDQIVLSETDESQVENESNPETIVDTRTQSPQTQTEASSQSQSLSQSMIKANISVTANINISLKITMNDSGSSSSSYEESSSSSESDDSPPPRNKKNSTQRKTFRQNEQTPKQSVPSSGKKTVPTETSNKKPDSTHKERQSITPRNKFLKSSQMNPEDYKTPEKVEIPVIDEDLQALLDSVYGETWKTPQLLRSCKKKNVREELRKSIYANNFETFVSNLPQDLESTRINLVPKEQKGSAKKNEFLSPQINEKAGSTKKKYQTPVHSLKENEEVFKKPVSSVKKTPRATRAKPKPKVPTPKYLGICDSDTSSSSDENDDDFKANDTWNASSDDDAEEAVRIRRRTIARQNKTDEDIVFVREVEEDRQKKLEDLLERSEYKKPPMLGETTPKISKKKLFTHSHFDDDGEDSDKIEEKENDVNEEDYFIQNPFIPPKKIDKPVKVTPKKTPTFKPTPLKLTNNYRVFSFLKSLDESVDVIYCHPEALTYRKSYKSKKTELTERLFKMYNEKVFGNQIIDVPIKWNKKLLNTAGRCNNSRRNGVRQSQLELSDKVLTSANRLRCTLIHEMCHAATWILQGENGHGATWKGWAAKANSVFPELPKISICHSYVIEYRYTYQCVFCKAKYQAHSKNKKVENIRCSICKNAIELFINKKNKEGETIMTPVSKEVRGFPKFVKLKYKEIKKPHMTHKDVMQVLSQQFACLTTQEKQEL